MGKFSRIQFGEENEKLLQKIEDAFYELYDRDIPISYDKEFFVGEHSKACGVCQYTLIDYKISTAKNFKIYVKGKDCYAWTTLAHEIGHYISITKYKDDSEAGADYEAGRFLCQILSKKEQKALDIWLSVFFNIGKKKEFENKCYTALDYLDVMMNHKEPVVLHKQYAEYLSGD